MPRQQRELDTSNPLHEFAAELRRARAQAGNPSYLMMARRSGGVSRTALSEAAGGDHLPKWATVEGFYRACKLPMPTDILEHWERLQEQLKPVNGNGHRNEDTTLEAPSESVRSSRRRRWLWPVMVGMLVVVTAVAVHMADVLMLPVGPSASPKPAKLAIIVIQNKVAMGHSDLLEDTSPVYLSSRPVPYCSRLGCVVPATTLSSGAYVVADCRTNSDMMWNYNLDSSEVQTNPNRAKSNLWYHVVLSSGASGYISEVYIEQAYRGGLGLPVCKGASAATNSPIPPAASGQP